MENDNKTEYNIEAFIKEHILADQTLLIEALLKNESIISCDDIQNLYASAADEEAYIQKQIEKWYLVDEYLGKRLFYKQEAIIDTGYGMWWGSTETKQPLSRDKVIQDLYNKYIEDEINFKTDKQ